MLLVQVWVAAEQPTSGDNPDAKARASVGQHAHEVDGDARPPGEALHPRVPTGLASKPGPIQNVQRRAQQFLAVLECEF